MRKLTLALLLIITSTISAQLPRSLYRLTHEITSYDEYDGSIYMRSNYKESTIIDEKLGTFDIKLKYNVYSDALEFNQKGKLFEVIKLPTVHVRVSDEYFYYCVFKTQRGLSRKGYYVLVEMNDKYRIYKKYTLKITEPIQNTVVKTGNPGEIKLANTYFVEENGIIVELPMNKKEMLRTFSDKAQELSTYLKKEKIRLRKEEDLIRLVAKYNALKSVGPNSSKSLLSNM